MGTHLTNQDFNKLNLCRRMEDLKLYTAGKPFSKNQALEILIKTGKYKHAIYNKSTGRLRGYRYDNFEKEDAVLMFNKMIEFDYINYLYTLKRDKLHPKVPFEGIRYYILNKIRLTECENSSWYKAKQSREKYKAKIESPDVRNCRALRQLYALFETQPFNYEMVLKIPELFKYLLQDKSQLYKSQDTRILYTVIQNVPSKDKDFRNVWQSLIKNNYLIPVKVRTPNGKTKIKPGVYRVNKDIVRRCLSALNV